MKSLLHILHLEDDPHDAALIQATLEEGGIACAVTRVERREEFVAALERGGQDLIISDFSLPKFDGTTALRIARAGWPALPVIIVSGTLGEERAIESLRNGAVDYILKERLGRLAPAVRRAMNEVKERAELMQAETERRESDERYHRLFDSMDEGFCVVELLFDSAGSAQDLRILEVNPSFAHQSGLPGATGKTARELLPTIEASWIRRFGEVALTGESVRFINRVEGLNRWFEVHAFRFGRPERRKVAILFSDVTARLTAEQTLRASEVRFRALSDSAPLGIFECDAAGRVTYFNPALTALSGQPPGGSLGNGWVNCFYPEDRFALRAGWRINVRRGNSSDVELRVRWPDGSVRWVHFLATPSRDATGRVTGFVGTVEDITARKAAEAALWESEQWLRAVFEQAAVGVVQIDVTTGRFLRVNQRFCAIVGRTHEEVERLSLLEITHPEDLAVDLANMAEIRDGSLREFTREKRYVRKDGAIVHVSLAVSAIRTSDEAPVSSIAIVQDITERKLLDEHVLQAQRMEALGQFSGGIAHDFNNILAAIGGYAELSRMRLKDNPEVREHLGSVLKATGRAADLVRQILTFSHQEPQERRVIHLQPIVAESLKLMRATIPTTIEFESTVEAEAPTVLANAGQVHQVIMNLGINAWHAMKDGAGRLGVTLERFTVTPEYAATKPRLRPGDYVRISVSDTGCGMDPAILRRIYEPFFTTKLPGQGTGLGLSVVHSIMDTHDGAITVHSQPGEGTIFRLYFPVDAGTASLLTMEPGPTPLGQGERVLVVDDEELLAELGEKILTRLGYAVESTTESAKALELVRADPARYALVLTDQTMPGMTGLQLASQLREIRPDLPVVLVTGYSLSLTAERIEAAGISKLLTKPFTINTLGTAVHTTLSAKPIRHNGTHTPY